MATSTVEDYVKAIYHLQQDAPTGEATVAGVAATLGVTKGSVTAMVRKLREAKLAEAERYGGIVLTRRGETLAIDMIRRHRLIECFLVEILGLDWGEVHEEAERLEHAMSRKVLDRLDAFLRHPAADPHGDPIPQPDGSIEAVNAKPLSDLDRGERGIVTRVTDQDAGFLEFVSRARLTPGARLTVVEREEPAGSVRVQRGRQPPVAMSLEAAGKILVSPA